MRFLKYFAMLSVLLVSSAYSRAQISIGIGIGGYSEPAYVYGPPACAYGYYNYEPYVCAPYGYYGPNWSRSGYYGREYYGRGYGYRGYGRESYGREGYEREGYRREGHGRGYERRGYAGGGRGYAGSYVRGGGRGGGRR